MTQRSGYKGMANDMDDLPTVDVDVEGIGMLTLRLAQILAEEVDLLDAMKISEIEALQEEKNRLTNALDRQKQLLARHPEMLDNLDDEQRDYLHQVVTVFEDVMQENHRRLMVARDVNLAIVDAIKDTVQESANRGVYSMHGVAESSNQTLSVTLNNVV